MGQRDLDGQELFERRLDNLIDNYADELGPAVVEMLLQQRAQDMREYAANSDGGGSIDEDDVGRW